MKIQEAKKLLEDNGYEVSKDTDSTLERFIETNFREGKIPKGITLRKDIDWGTTDVRGQNSAPFPKNKEDVTIVNLYGEYYFATDEINLSKRLINLAKIDSDSFVVQVGKNLKDIFGRSLGFLDDGFFCNFIWDDAYREYIDDNPRAEDFTDNEDVGEHFWYCDPEDAEEETEEQKKENEKIEEEYQNAAIYLTIDKDVNGVWNSDIRKNGGGCSSGHYGETVKEALNSLMMDKRLFRENNNVYIGVWNQEAKKKYFKKETMSPPSNIIKKNSKITFIGKGINSLKKALILLYKQQAHFVIVQKEQ